MTARERASEIDTADEEAKEREREKEKNKKKRLGKGVRSSYPSFRWSSGGSVQSVAAQECGSRPVVLVRGRSNDSEAASMVL